MTATEELRGQLQARRRRPALSVWHAPLIRHFRSHTRVQAFDATLSHTGWVVAERIEDKVLVHYRGTIHLTTNLTGYLSTWEKARLLRDRAREVLDLYGAAAEKVVEAPAVAGNRLESSLIAGLLLWLETMEPTGLGCGQISAQHVSAVLCGNARMKSAERKKAVKEACAFYVPESAGRGWNEHERDALALALTHLHDQRRRDGHFSLIGSMT